MDIEELKAKILELDRYEQTISYGCPCCDDTGSPSMEVHVNGDYLRVDDVLGLFREN